MESLLFNTFSLFNAPTTGPLKRLFHNDHEKTIAVWLQRIAGCLVRRNNVGLLRDVRRVLKIKLDSTLDIKKRCPDYILLNNSAQSKQKISTHRSYFHTAAHRCATAYSIFGPLRSDFHSTRTGRASVQGPGRVSVLGRNTHNSISLICCRFVVQVVPTVMHQLTGFRLTARGGPFSVAELVDKPCIPVYEHAV